MKKGKKLLLTTVVTMLFTLFLGINVFAAEVEPIVPTPKDFKAQDEGSRVDAATDWLTAAVQAGRTDLYYEYTTENGLISVPIQVSKPGRVYISVRFKERDRVVEGGFGLIVSASDDVMDKDAWLKEISALTMIFGGSSSDFDDVGVAFTAEKAGTFYLHGVSKNTVDDPLTIQAAAIQTSIPVKASNVKLSKTSVTYNGKEQKPAVTAEDFNGKISSSNYTVKYSNNKNVGQATATITFKNAYSGTIKKTFTILPKGTTISKVTAKSKGFTAKWKKQASQTDGYEIQYATASNFKGAKTVGNIKAKTTSKSITKLKAGKKYYVRIRTYKTAKVNGKNKKLCSSWSKAKTVTTKK